MNRMDTAKESLIDAAPKREAEPRRAHSALIRAVLRSLGPQRQRFWRGPGLVVIVCCLIQTAAVLLLNIHINQSGGSVTFSPGGQSTSFLGLPTQWWVWLNSLGLFLGPAATAWGWLSLAQTASQRLVDFFEDAAAPRLKLSQALRFEAACRFAWPALLPAISLLFLQTLVLLLLFPVSLPLWIYALLPFDLGLRSTSILLPLLFITALQQLSPRWAVFLAILQFMPRADLFTDLLAALGLYSTHFRQLPHQRLDLGLPGAQLYGLLLLGFALYAILRWRGAAAWLPLLPVAFAQFARKISADFAYLPISYNPAPGQALLILDTAMGVKLLAGLRGITEALGSLPYSVHGPPGFKGGAILSFTAFPLLALPIQAWFACLIYIVAPIYLWLCYLALRWLLSRAPRDIISDHR